MNWRTILNTNLETEPLAHNPHNPQNPALESNCADIADIAHRGTNSKPDLMAEIERYCKANTSTPEQLKNWLNYFTELAAEDPAICLLCVTKPPVWKTAAEREQIGKPANQTIHRRA